MKYSTIIGLLLVVVGLLLFILQKPYYTEKEFYIAALLGSGIGLILGGFMGYAQKKRNKIVENRFEPRPEESFKKQALENNPDETGLKF